MKSEPTPDNRRLCKPRDAGDNVEIDPEFQDLLPPLSAGELASLHESIDAEQGCRDALIVWKGHDTLVDGHNRITYCREKGYAFWVVEKEFADKDAVRAYVVNEHLGRRNFSPAAESYLRGRRYLAAKQQGARTDLTSGQTDQKSSAERLGEELQVGEKTIRRDARFAEAVDAIVTNCGAGVKNLILSRETGFTRGGVLRLAGLKAEEQRKFLRELKESGKRPRQRRKGKKRDRITIPTQPKALVEALVKQLGAKELAEVSKALARAIEARGKKGTGEPTKERSPRSKTKATKR